MQQPTGVGPPPHESSAENAETFETAGQGQALPATDADPYANESPEGNLVNHPPINCEMPPQQVYVTAAVAGMHPADISGLEHQFQSLGFKQEDSSGTDQLTNSGPNSENNLDDHDGEDVEDDPLKLFVGQVRRSDS